MFDVLGAEGGVADNVTSAEMSFSAGFLDKIEQEISRKSQLNQLIAELAHSDEQSTDSDSLKQQLYSLLNSGALDPVVDIEMDDDELQIAPEKLSQIQAAVDNLPNKAKDTQPIVFSAHIVDQLEREISRREQIQNLRGELIKSTNGGFLDVTYVRNILQRVAELSFRPRDSEPRDHMTEIKESSHLQQTESATGVHYSEISTCHVDHGSRGDTNVQETEDERLPQNVHHSARACVTEYVNTTIRLVHLLSSRPSTNICQRSLDNLNSLREKLRSDQLTPCELEEAKTMLLNELFFIFTIVTDETSGHQSETLEKSTELSFAGKDEGASEKPEWNNSETLKDLTEQVQHLNNMLANLEKRKRGSQE